MQTEGVSEDVKLAGPWIRFWARFFDELLTYSPFLLIGSYLLKCLIGEASQMGFMSIFSTLISFVFSSILEAFCLSKFGSTPGKWFFSLNVLKVDHSKLSFKEAFSRNWKVRFWGMGLGLGIFFIICSLIEKSNLDNKGSTSWDEGSYIVEQSKVHLWRVIVFSLLMSTLLGLLIIGLVFNKVLK